MQFNTHHGHLSFVTKFALMALLVGVHFRSRGLLSTFNTHWLYRFSLCCMLLTYVTFCCCQMPGLSSLKDIESDAPDPIEHYSYFLETQVFIHRVYQMF